MTREEEILTVAEKQRSISEERAFARGARWADHTMIERATAWLKSHMYDDSEYGKLMIEQFKYEMQNGFTERTETPT